MTIGTELEALVRIYADYDQEKKCYIGDLNKETLLYLEAAYIKIINKFLLIDGPDKAKIAKNYKKLSLNFHPDLKDRYSSEIIWLEKKLSEDLNDGSCFKTLNLCYEKLISPQNFKSLKFDEINSREDLKQWLENLKNNSKTFTERNLYVSLLALFDKSMGYFDETGKIKPKGIRLLISFLPLVFISFSTFVFAEELLAVYGLYFALLKSGQYMGTSHSEEFHTIGKELQKSIVVTATATTIILVRLVEMTFWASRQCYDISLQIGSTLLKTLNYAPEMRAEENAEENLCRELILANQNPRTRENFKTPQLKMIAAPIESCIGLLEQQFFRGWRPGGGKHRALEAFLLRLRVIDKDDEVSLEDKIVKANEMLALVKKNSTVYTVGGKTALAVDRAERVILMLKEAFFNSELKCN